MDAATATQSQLPISSGTMTDVPLSSGVESIESQSIPTDSVDAVNKTKRDSLKGFFRRKKNEQVDNVSNNLEAANSDTSHTAECSSIKSNSLGKRFARIGKVVSNVSSRKEDTKVEATDSLEARKGFKTTLSNYWNSIFKKSQKEDNSKSTEEEEEVERIVATVKPDLNVEVENAGGQAIKQNIVSTPGQIPVGQS